MIDAYNAGSLNAEEFFQQLVAFAQSLNEEEQRGVGEQLNEEELALFDLLTKPQIELSDADRDKVKATARELLATLKAGKLVLDWRKRQQARAEVRVTIEKVLDQGCREPTRRNCSSKRPPPCSSTSMTPTMARGAVCMRRRQKPAGPGKDGLGWS